MKKTALTRDMTTSRFSELEQRRAVSLIASLCVTSSILWGIDHLAVYYGSTLTLNSQTQSTFGRAADSQR